MTLFSTSLLVGTSWRESDSRPSLPPLCAKPSTDFAETKVYLHVHPQVRVIVRRQTAWALKRAEQQPNIIPTPRLHQHLTTLPMTTHSDRPWHSIQQPRWPPHWTNVTVKNRQSSRVQSKPGSPVHCSLEFTRVKVKMSWRGFDWLTTDTPQCTHSRNL